MKKLIFTLISLVAIAGLSSSAWAQTATTPYLGGTYVYRVTGLDNSTGANMTINLRYQLNQDNVVEDADLATPVINAVAAPNTGTVNFANARVSTDNGVSFAAHPITGPTGKNAVLSTVANNVDVLEFQVTYGTGLTAGTASRIWVEVIDGTAGCVNQMFINVTPATNNLFYAMSLVTAATYCPETTVPTAELTDAVNDNTPLRYRVTRTNGNNAYDWQFTLTDAGVTAPQTYTTAVFPVLADGTLGTAITGAAGVYRVVSTTADPVNVVEIVYTVAVVPGQDNTDFSATAGTFVQYVNQSTTTISFSGETGVNPAADNSGTITLTRIPAIGNFIGL